MAKTSVRIRGYNYIYQIPIKRTLVLLASQADYSAHNMQTYLYPESHKSHHSDLGVHKIVVKTIYPQQIYFLSKYAK